MLPLGAAGLLGRARVRVGVLLLVLVLAGTLLLTGPVLGRAAGLRGSRLGRLLVVLVVRGGGRRRLGLRGGGRALALPGQLVRGGLPLGAGQRGLHLDLVLVGADGGVAVLAEQGVVELQDLDDAAGALDLDVVRVGLGAADERVAVDDPVAGLVLLETRAVAALAAVVEHVDVDLLATRDVLQRGDVAGLLGAAGGEAEDGADGQRDSGYAEVEITSAHESVSSDRCNGCYRMVTTPLYRIILLMSILLCYNILFTPHLKKYPIFMLYQPATVEHHIRQHDPLPMLLADTA